MPSGALRTVTDEVLEAPGELEALRYTEELDPNDERSRRACSLYAQGIDEPVSELELVPFRCRVGEAVAYAEGFAGVSTRPEHRGKGYIRVLFRRAMAGIGTRSNLSFLYGIEGLYGKFGFVSSLPESSMQIWIRRLPAAPEPGHRARSVRRDHPDRERELGHVVSLYNEIHSRRPWTHVRDGSTVAKLAEESSWRPAPETVLVYRGDAPVAYALYPGRTYGQTRREFVVAEAGATDAAAARALLYELGRRCIEAHLSEMTIQEPEDGAVGTVARALGCTAKRATTPDGGGMAAILDRAGLIAELGDELTRRAVAAGAGPIPPEMIAGLSAGRICPDDRDLVRLLFGFFSYGEVEALRGPLRGRPSTSQHTQMLHALFPGGGSPTLPLAYAHRLDRY